MTLYRFDIVKNNVITHSYVAEREQSPQSGWGDGYTVLQTEVTQKVDLEKTEQKCSEEMPSQKEINLAVLDFLLYGKDEKLVEMRSRIDVLKKEYSEVISLGEKDL